MKNSLKRIIKLTIILIAPIIVSNTIVIYTYPSRLLTSAERAFIAGRISTFVYMGMFSIWVIKKIYDTIIKDDDK